MSVEGQVREAIVEELRRQAEVRETELKVEKRGESLVAVEGTIELDDLVMSIMGSVAGGP